jgi:hypothetical protein
MRTLIATVLAVTLLSGCENPNSVGGDGRLTGTLQSAPWVGTATLGAGPDDGMVLVSRAGIGSSMKMIGVRFDHPETPGTYPIPVGGAWYEASTTGADPYFATAVSGTLVITSADANSMRGTLQITFVGPGDEQFEFTEGVFETRLGRRLL